MCNTSDSLVRIPGSFTTNTKQVEDIQVGSVVKKSIDELREELKHEKENLKNEFFKPDE